MILHKTLDRGSTWHMEQSISKIGCSLLADVCSQTQPVMLVSFCRCRTVKLYQNIKISVIL